ncbi:MAG: hypothetical protein ACI4NU_02685 [Christensenellales bacterium]
MKRKILALLLSLAMLLSIGGMVEGTLAVGISVDSTRSSVTLGEVDTAVTPTPEAESTVEPETTPEATPAPTVEPEATPASTVEPKTEPSLFERLMACTTLEEVWIIMDGTSDAEFEALTDEQWDAIDDLIFQLDPINKAPEPPEESEPVVESEIIYPTVNFDEVAPFGDPVVGGEG